METSSASRILGLPVLAFVALGGLATACSGPTTTDAGDVIATDTSDTASPSDVIDAMDTGADASDALDVADAASEAGEEAGADASDATPDATDASDGGGTVSFSAMVQMPSVFQNCMPIVAMDPVTATGTVDISNDGTASIGPITATGGAIITESGTSLATFTIPMLTIPTITPGTRGSAMFTKDGGSLMPANGCSTLMCNQPVRIAIDISGPNIPSGTRAMSAIAMVQCAF